MGCGNTKNGPAHVFGETAKQCPPDFKNKLPHPVIEGFSNILKSQTYPIKPELDARKLPSKLRPNDINFSSVLNHGIHLNEDTRGKTDSMAHLEETPGKDLRDIDINNQLKNTGNESGDNVSTGQVNQKLGVTNLVFNDVIYEREEESKQEQSADQLSVIEDAGPTQQELQQIEEQRLLEEQAEQERREAEEQRLLEEQAEEQRFLEEQAELKRIEEEENQRLLAEHAERERIEDEERRLLAEKVELERIEADEKRLLAENEERHKREAEEHKLIAEKEERERIEAEEQKLLAKQAERAKKEKEAIDHATKKASDLKEAEMDALRELQGEMEKMEVKANNILSRYDE